MQSLMMLSPFFREGISQFLQVTPLALREIKQCFVHLCILIYSGDLLTFIVFYLRTQSGGSLYPPQVADCGIGLSTAEGTTQQQGLEELDVSFNFLHARSAIQNVISTGSHNNVFIFW